MLCRHALHFGTGPCRFGFGLVERRLRRGLPCHQLALAVPFQNSQSLACLGGGQSRVGLREAGLKLFRVDSEKQGILRHDAALGKADFRDETADPRTDIDLLLGNHTSVERRGLDDLRHRGRFDRDRRKRLGLGKARPGKAKPETKGNKAAPQVR